MNSGEDAVYVDSKLAIIQLGKFSVHSDIPHRFDALRSVSTNYSQTTQTPLIRSTLYGSLIVTNIYTVRLQT